MPQTIQHGGTNGVPELDLGLPGGTLFIALSAASTMSLTFAESVSPIAESAMPDQSFVALQRGGFHGQNIVAECILKTTTHAILDAILFEIERRKHEADLMRPTRLINNVTARQWDRVVIRESRPTDRRRLNVAGEPVLPYRIVFGVLTPGGAAVP